MTTGSDPAAVVVDTDVCVIGAGPAGLTFARECAGAPFRVLVLESGLYEPDDAAQGLAEGTVDSPFHGPHALSLGRARRFGGTAGNWAHATRPDVDRAYARTLPGEALDFEVKAWQPGSGWPFGLDELRGHYDRAHLAWAGSSVDNDAATWARPATPPLPLRPGPLVTKVAQYGPADVFTTRIRDELRWAANVTVQVGSTVVALEAVRDGSAIRRATVVRTDGTTCTVTAEVFVLACGGVENVQTLLLSEATRPGARGNRHDNVGRYVTDHPEFRLGALRPSAPDLVDRLGLYDLHHVGDQLVNGLLTLDEGYKRDERLLNVGAVFVPRRGGFNSAAERALHRLRPLLRGGRVEQPLAQVRTLLSAPADTAAVLRSLANLRLRPWHRTPDGYVWYRGGWSSPEVDRSRFRTVEVHVATEQSPHRDNRLTLGDDRDALGRHRLRLRWAWSAADQENLLRTTRVLAAELEGSGLGRFEPWVEFTGAARPRTDGLHHPMGGTRMHVDPELGVVDENCRVHGVANLYVAGSSVFPTGLGYVNPTLTVTALATRLADHVRAALAGTGPGWTAEVGRGVVALGSLTPSGDAA